MKSSFNLIYMSRHASRVWWGTLPHGMFQSLEGRDLPFNRAISLSNFSFSVDMAAVVYIGVR